jgi:hypothetical protein
MEAFERTGDLRALDAAVEAYEQLVRDAAPLGLTTTPRRWRSRASARP